MDNCVEFVVMPGNIKTFLFENSMVFLTKFISSSSLKLTNSPVVEFGNKPFTNESLALLGGDEKSL